MPILMYSKYLLLLSPLRNSILSSSTRSVHVYTNNRVALSGMQNKVLKGPSNLLIRRILVLTAAYNIHLESSWLPLEENTLADSLSRFDRRLVALLYP